MKLILKHKNVFANVETVGAYLSVLEIDGHNILKPADDGISTHGGSAVLVPFSGRVKNGKYFFEGHEYILPLNDNMGNSIHGFVRKSNFTVIKERKDEIVLRTEITEESYPTSLILDVKYRAYSNKFLSSFTVANTGSKNSPLIVGAHPYFTVSNNWKLLFSKPLFEFLAKEYYFPNGKIVRANQKYSNEPSSFYEHLFYKGGGKISLINEDAVIEIMRHNMDYLTIYTGEFTEGKSIAIEPQSGIPDAYNSGIGLKIIKPRERMNFWFTISLNEC
jgi:aldose 1-epimerase